MATEQLVAGVRPFWSLDPSHGQGHFKVVVLVADQLVQNCTSKAKTTSGALSSASNPNNEHL